MGMIAMERKPEDFREAAKIAADAAKTLITIAVAAAGVAAAYFQFARTQDSLTTVVAVLIFIALFLFVTSMIAGMMAISRIYKRAEGRIDLEKSPAWTTQPVIYHINVQALMGLIGLIVLAAALFQSATTPVKQWSLVAPNQSLAGVFTGSKIQIFGNWDELFVRDEKNNWIRFDRVPQGERRVIEINQK